MWGDFSSNNGVIDVAAYAASRYGTLVRRRPHWFSRKVSQGVDYFWAAGEDYARQAHRLGLHVIHYHYLMPEFPAVQAKWFLEHAGPQIHPGDLLMVDVEFAGDSPGDLAVFHRAIRAGQPGTPPVYYLPDWYLATRPKLAELARTLNLPVMASDYAHRTPVNTARQRLVGHQFTDRYHFAGVHEPVAGQDANRWLINPAALFGF